MDGCDLVVHIYQVTDIKDLQINTIVVYIDLLFLFFNP